MMSVIKEMCLEEVIDVPKMGMEMVRGGLLEGLIFEPNVKGVGMNFQVGSAGRG